ncbi:MAG: BrnT family toxin [Chloroflexia bacterium]|nr:BrnT family toxin [Chloroflexia bacterium]
MQFEWDESKRLSNLDKHGIDFIGAMDLFDGRPEWTSRSAYGFEERYVTTGLIEDRFVTVVWTRRSDKIRLISARRARDGEERACRAVHN